MFCIQCGSELEDGSVFCHVCGSKAVVSEQTEQEKASVISPPPAPAVTQYTQPVSSGSLPVQTINTAQRKKSKLP